MTAVKRMRIVAGQWADARGEGTRPMLTIVGDRIVEVTSWNDATRPEPGDIDARDSLLLPGFIDIHVHGGAGRSLMEGEASALETVAQHLARHGVTGFLGTTVTAPWEQQKQALAVIAQHMRESGDLEPVAARVLGCHLEGPYINPAKKGAQPGQYILAPDVKDFRDQTGDNLKAVKIVTLAPEMEGALELIQALTVFGIIASIGHTNATYDQVSAGIQVGARHVTHCFNAMRPMEGREPGVVGATLARPELMAELIWDNIHVHPGSCHALVRAKTSAGVILISDGIPGAGMPEDYVFSLGDLPAKVQGGAARLPDGTLAGSLLTLETAFRNASPLTLAQRAAMTSYNAARSLGLGQRKGLLSPGYDADLVLLDSSGSVRQCFIGGHSVLPEN